MPITIEIVTPTQLVLRKTVDAFTGPGEIGEFGVLAGHRPLLASLKAGIAKYSEGGAEHRLAVGPGFAELDNDRIIVLTEKALDPAKLATPEDRQAELASAEADRERSDAALRAWTGPVGASEFQEAQLALEWAQARLSALRS
ncbi:MAG: F0F1 ATP synthase subunit epsilon [Deltaproteobacteria bacterium]|nr:F0F1 ATP synthase subunit epsilon [Deltaproteobacteria bacterium]